jgi:hypothetical protein
MLCCSAIIPLSLIACGAQEANIHKHEKPPRYEVFTVLLSTPRSLVLSKALLRDSGLCVEKIYKPNTGLEPVSSGYILIEVLRAAIAPVGHIIRNVCTGLQ